MSEPSWLDELYNPNIGDPNKAFVDFVRQEILKRDLKIKSLQSALDEVKGEVEDVDRLVRENQIFRDEYYKIKEGVERLKIDLERSDESCKVAVRCLQDYEESDEQIQELVNTLTDENAKLEALLKEIEEHEHCDPRRFEISFPTNPDCDTQLQINHAQGHRCCAEIAKRRHEK